LLLRTLDDEVSGSVPVAATSSGVEDPSGRIADPNLPAWLVAGIFLEYWRSGVV